MTVSASVHADRATVREVNLKSLQDTSLTAGSVYLVNSYLEVWTSFGGLGRAEIVHARNGASGYCYVFVDSKISSDAPPRAGTSATGQLRPGWSPP